MKILISNSYESLADARPDHTVEAEYGSFEVKGLKNSLSHHGPRSSNPAPCVWEDELIPAEEGDTIGVSHIDLDCLGGIAQVLDLEDILDNPLFWELVAHVDVHGPHTIEEWEDSFWDEDISSASGEYALQEAREAIKMLHAYWAWALNHRVFAPQHGCVMDATSQVQEHLDFLLMLNQEESGYKEALQAGAEWKAKEVELERSSFVKEENKVVLRSSTSFVNHLYRKGHIVVSFSETHKTVTISRSEKSVIDCCAIVQHLWGEKAGGREGIAGSPRGKILSFKDAEMAFDYIVGGSI